MCLTTHIDYINQQDFLHTSHFFLQNLVDFKFYIWSKMCTNMPNLMYNNIYSIFQLCSIVWYYPIRNWATYWTWFCVRVLTWCIFPHVVYWDYWINWAACVSAVQGLVDGIGNNISSFSKVFPVQSCLSNFTIFISHAHAKIEDHYPEIDQMDFYRYAELI